MSDHGRWIWYELITPDMAGAKRFYGDLVGWSAQDMPPMPGAEPYSILNADGNGVAGMMNLGEPMKAEGMPPNWTGYICVDDCDAAAAKAKALGGSVRREPLDIPGIGRFAIVADPAGAIFAIMKPIPMKKPDDAPMACWNFYFRAGDIDAAADRAKAGGAQILLEPMEVPGGDWVFQGVDPQGAVFSVLGAKAA